MLFMVGLSLCSSPNVNNYVHRMVVDPKIGEYVWTEKLKVKVKYWNKYIMQLPLRTLALLLRGLRSRF
jgi:hypothetical protein